MGYKGKEKNRKSKYEYKGVEVECSLMKEFDSNSPHCEKCIEFEGVCLMELALNGRKQLDNK